MRLEKRNGAPERRILTAMIVDEVVLAKISGKWTEEGLFKSKWANIVGGWCCEYFERYQRAPGKSVEGMFEAWATRSRDKETIDLVERFLEGLSDDYEQLADGSNSEYVIDLAAQHFLKVSLARLKEAIDGDLDLDKIEDAARRVEKFSRIDTNSTQNIEVFMDELAIEQAFNKKSDPIINYPHALGEFFKDALERDALVAFMGPEKVGKSFWLIDVVWRAITQHRKVAFFHVGDMSEGQVLLRLAARACRRPYEERPQGKGKPVKFPSSLMHDPDQKFATVEHDEFYYESRMTSAEALSAFKRYVKKKKLAKDCLALSVHPNGSINVAGLVALLQSWERDGWGTPDVICIDYADLLAPPHGVVESRDAINATWKQLRSLSQSLHCLVVTATQSDAESYTKETISMSNFSEDKRKLSHVTGMVGINQTSEEKKQGLQRLNWIVLRNSDYSPDEVVHVAGCLAIANPAIRSIF